MAMMDLAALAGGEPMAGVASEQHGKLHGTKVNSSTGFAGAGCDWGSVGGELEGVAELGSGEVHADDKIGPRVPTL